LTTPTNRVLSGMRPTGRLHIGHYFGALQNWVKLQSDPANECFYFVADWHALTSDYESASAIADNVLQITIDYLASGIDPNKSVIFQQSQIIEHAELHLLLSMITPLGWLERVPTYKEALDNIVNKDLHTYGFLGYPTLQTADIVMYCKRDREDKLLPLYVPVGEDQVSHVEFSRELVRRFNSIYGVELDPAILNDTKAVELLYGKASDTLIKRESWPGRPFAEHFLVVLRRLAQGAGAKNFLESIGEYARYFTSVETLREPEALLTKTPRIPGLDGRKMSKSYGNAITLSESDADIRSKTKVMVTDPARKRRTDPGNPDICPVYDWHKLFSTPDRDPGRLDWVRTGCTTAGIGCIECKSAMADNLIQWIQPVRARRLEHEQNPKRVLEILDNGSTKARESAKQTMSRVRESIFAWQRKRQEISG
jgi:tryptophanyl-tRNA synthetase